MTGSFCSTCGAQLAPGARFCASCGTAVAAPPATGEWQAPQAAQPPVSPQHTGTPAAPGAPQHQTPAHQTAQFAAPVHPAPHQAPGTAGQQQPDAGQQQPAHPAQQPASAQPQYPAPPAHPAQPQYPGQQQWAAGPPQPGTGASPAGAAPWGAPQTAPRPSGTPGRSPVDALLNGDWAGAARAAGIAVGAMIAVSLVGVLIATSGGIGFRETVALVFGAVCLAVGGDAFVRADAEVFGGSVSLGLLPLTVTLVGLGLLGRLFAVQLRRQQSSTTELLLQGVRTALVFTVCFLPLALLTRYSADEANALGLSGRLGVGVFSSVFGALLFAVAALGLTWAFHRRTALPGKLGGLRDRSSAPLLGALAVFSVGLLGVLVALIVGLIEDDGKMAQIGIAILGAGNGALASVLWSAGVPLHLDGNVTGSLPVSTPSASDNVDLFTFTDANGWFWLAPVVLLAVLLLVAIALAVRQDTIEDARREGLRFAGALAVVAFLATLLLRIGLGSEGAAAEFSGSADGSAMFNPIVAAVVLALWGVVAGLLAPVLAAKVPPGFVTGVRRRFGSAGGPPPVAR